MFASEVDDGVPSQSSVRPPSQDDGMALFAELDTNGDGELTRSELLALCKTEGMPKWQVDSLYRDLDIDGDGKVCIQ